MTYGRWYLPTRKRIGKLQAFLVSAIATGISTPGVILVHKPEFDELFYEYGNLELPPNWTFHTTESEGMGDKFRELWPSIKEHKWMGWLVDDLVCETPEWDKKLLAKLNGKNFASANDGGQFPHRMCVPVFSKALLNAVGYVYPPGFWHTYLDNLWETLGRETGCWEYCDDIKLIHNHSFKNQQLVNPDDTEAKSYSHFQEDAEAWARWLKYCRAQAVANIKAMQNG